MKQVLVILCFTCIVRFRVVSGADIKDESRLSDQRSNVKQEKTDDLEGSETSARLFLGSLFPTYNPYPTYRPVGYPTYNPSTTAGTIPPYYPNTGYYPTGTNVLGTGYSGYPTQSYYPTYGYSQRGYGSSSGYGGYRGYGGYGGYGGNGGLNSYYGYSNPEYSGKRNLGYGYYSDTDRYGFYRSPSQTLSVNRGYD